MVRDSENIENMTGKWNQQNQNEEKKKRLYRLDQTWLNGDYFPTTLKTFSPRHSEREN